MQNDVLKNNIEPWQEKGRWYHGVLNGDNTLDLLNSDKYIIDNFSIGGGYVNIVKANDFLIDLKIKIPTGPTATSSFSETIYRFNNGKMGFVAPANRATTSKMEFWAFILNN